MKCKEGGEEHQTDIETKGDADEQRIIYGDKQINRQVHDQQGSIETNRHMGSLILREILEEIN